MSAFMTIFDIKAKHVCHGCQLRGDHSEKNVALTDLFERPESKPFAVCVKCLSRVLKGQFEALEQPKEEPATPLFNHGNGVEV